MKILYHHRTLSKDGQNVHIDELIAAFRRAGHEVRIVGPAAHANADFGSDGGLLSRVRAILPRWIAEVMETAYSLLAFARLKRAQHEFGADFIYERYNLFLLAGVWLKRLTGLPLVLEVNAPLARERKENSGLSLEGLARWCERYVWKSADLVLPVTSALADELKAAGVREERIFVMPNGVDTARFNDTVSGGAVRGKYGLGTRLVIGFSGFLRDWHGLPIVLDVMDSLRGTADLHFLVVGDGPARGTLESTVSEKKLGDRVTLTGLTQRAEMPAMIAAFDIAVQPKATFYASPLKLFEYMAAGRAIMAPAQANLQEILTDGVNALLFAPDDWDSFRSALQRLIAEPALRERLARAARATIEDRQLTWNGNVRRITAALATQRPSRGAI